MIEFIVKVDWTKTHSKCMLTIVHVKRYGVNRKLRQHSQLWSRVAGVLNIGAKRSRAKRANASSAAARSGGAQGAP